MGSKRLGDYAKVQGGYAYKSKDFSDTGIPVIKIKNVGKGSLLYNEVSYVDESFLDTTSNFVTQEGDVLISMTGSNINQPASMVGRVARVAKSDPLSFINQRVGRILLKEEGIVDIRFLYYYLSQYEVQYYLVSNATGSANQVNINGKLIESIEIPDYDYPTTKKIAHILSTLDDKIELNRKMNQTLEEMAQALFKSWLVDFDPVHAKAGCKSDDELEAAAKELGISKEVLELFPSEFVESEMGMIPLGWEVKPLDQIAHYQNGLALQKFRPKDEDNFLPVLKIAQLKKGYADGEEKADPNIKPECIVDDGDVVFSWSGSLVVDVWCGGKVALNQHLFKVTSTEYAKWFYYLWTKQHLLNFQRVAEAKAVTMGHIKRSHLAEALCVIPDDNTFKMAEVMINPLLDKLILNRLEINSLQKTRDALLPKLLSGELDVSSLEVA